MGHSRVFAVESQEGKTPAGMNLLLSCALLSAVVWSSWSQPQYIVSYTPQHHIVPYSPNPFFRYHSTAPLPLPTAYAYGSPVLPYQGYQPRQGFVYDNEVPEGRFLGSFGGATLVKATTGTATTPAALTGAVHITQSIFIANSQAVLTITGVSFKNNAVYMVWIGDAASATINNNSPLPTAAAHTPTNSASTASSTTTDSNNKGEILGAFKYRSGIIPGIKLTAASRFYNIDGMGMSKAGMLVASPGQFASAAVPSNPTIAAQKMVKMSGKYVCVYEFTSTTCNSPLTSSCTIARAGCGKIG